MDRQDATPKKEKALHDLIAVAVNNSVIVQQKSAKVDEAKNALYEAETEATKSWNELYDLISSYDEKYKNFKSFTDSKLGRMISREKDYQLRYKR